MSTFAGSGEARIRRGKGESKKRITKETFIRSKFVLKDLFLVERFHLQDGISFRRVESVIRISNFSAVYNKFIFISSRF